VEFSEFGEPHDITEILTKSAEKARAFYAGEIDKDGNALEVTAGEEKHSYDIPAAKEESRITPSAKITPGGGGGRITPAKKAAAAPAKRAAAKPKEDPYIADADTAGAHDDTPLASSNGHSDWGTGPTDEQIEELTPPTSGPGWSRWMWRFPLEPGAFCW